MKKVNCEIVKDLFPNYIENQISDTTKNFVENHIKSCKDCNDTLKFLMRRN